MTGKSKLRQYLFLTVVLLIAAFVINANSVIFGSIKGVLTDMNTGKPVVSAVVTIIGTDIKAITDSKGEFVINGLKTGLYDLKIEDKQLGSTIIKAISVQISMTTTVVQQIEFDKIGKTDKPTEDKSWNEESKRQGKQINKPVYITLTKGKITGVITDASNNQPLVGVSVAVKGTSWGAVTNPDGRYTILNVPVGTYTLRITAVGYSTIEVLNVEVHSNLATYQSHAMTTSDTELKQVIRVDCEAPLVVRDKTTTIDIVRSEEITSMPSKGFEKIVKLRGGRVSEVLYYPPAHGGNAIVNGEAFDAMFFKNYGVNPFVDTEDDNLSTFAIDVDDASFIMTRSYLDRNELVPSEAVRAEEFVNHFDYGYKAPHNEPFKVFLEGAPSRFGEHSQLLKIGIKGMEIDPEDRKDANLIFVIDVSGSMNREDRLELVKKSLLMLVDQLNRQDKIGIVVYGSNGRVLLEPTSLKKKKRIIRVINSLCPGGATNAEEGLRLGYKMAEKMFNHNRINRIILCSDGVANVGRTGPDQILKRIKKYANRGITLSTVGFGMGNYNDILMEKLGNKGNGSYAYVDNLAEAHRIFVDNLTGNLQVIARDVKIQVDFNPDVVRSYRLIGYENRDVADDKFRDDKEDGGEIGAGHEVTALYEIKLHKNVSGRQMGRVFIRYKDASGEEVNEISRVIKSKLFAQEFEDASLELRLAACAAEFGEILRKSYWARSSNIEDVIMEVTDLMDERRDDQIIELVEMLAKYKKLENRLAKF
jgi:Ca-activated chloride channel family protein